MNYTDAQIKQVLKCCGDDGCKECPVGYFAKDDFGCELYSAKLYLLALDLINRKEAEKAELQREIASCKAKIEALKMENAQLQTDNFNANMNLEHVQAEIERLRKENAVLVESNHILATEYVEQCTAKAKSEAIKEFAERLKGIATATHKTIDGQYRYEITNDFIDNLVKGMVGEGE